MISKGMYYFFTYRNCEDDRKDGADVFELKEYCAF
jgi:hypothetical protein